MISAILLVAAVAAGGAVAGGRRRPVLLVAAAAAAGMAAETAPGPGVRFDGRGTCAIVRDGKTFDLVQINNDRFRFRHRGPAQVAV